MPLYMIMVLLRFSVSFLFLIKQVQRTSLYGHPLDTDTRIYGQLRLSQRKAHIISLKSTRLKRTPVNTDYGHFSLVPSDKLLYFTVNPTLRTLYFAHCPFSLSHYVLIVEIVPCSNNERFLRVDMILLLKSICKKA